ncbi:MAG TPA: DUF5668 domain-containing protein [Anaerolineae bacterium]
MRRSIFWPLLLVIAGTLLLLSNFGLLRASAWDLIRTGWPVLLVAIGLDVLLRSASRARGQR